MKIILLPSGITGFGSPKRSITDKEFLQLCFHIKIIFNYKDFEHMNTNSTNYYVGRFTSEDNKLFIIMNKYYPYVTTADRYEFGNISFVENSDIKSCIDSLEYRFVDSIDAEYNIYKYLEVEQLTI